MCRSNPRFAPPFGVIATGSGQTFTVIQNHEQTPERCRSNGAVNPSVPIEHFVLAPHNRHFNHLPRRGLPHSHAGKIFRVSNPAALGENPQDLAYLHVKMPLQRRRASLAQASGSILHDVRCELLHPGGGGSGAGGERKDMEAGARSLRSARAYSETFFPSQWESPR